jgi:hypothetical protein
MKRGDIAKTLMPQTDWYQIVTETESFVRPD